MWIQMDNTDNKVSLLGQWEIKKEKKDLGCVHFQTLKENLLGTAQNKSNLHPGINVMLFL
jgi:hypothetical protein